MTIALRIPSQSSTLWQSKKINGTQIPHRPLGVPPILHMFGVISFTLISACNDWVFSNKTGSVFCRMVQTVLVRKQNRALMTHSVCHTLFFSTKTSCYFLPVCSPVCYFTSVSRGVTSGYEKRVVQGFILET